MVFFPHRNPKVSCLIHFAMEAPKQEATTTKWQSQGKNWAALFQTLALSTDCKLYTTRKQQVWNWKPLANVVAANVKFKHSFILACILFWCTVSPLWMCVCVNFFSSQGYSFEVIHLSFAICCHGLLTSSSSNPAKDCVGNDTQNKQWGYTLHLVSFTGVRRNTVSRSVFFYHYTESYCETIRQVRQWPGLPGQHLYLCQDCSVFLPTADVNNLLRAQQLHMTRGLSVCNEAKGNKPAAP